MEIDHYPEEYGDSLAENIAEELGSETAAALANTDQLRDRLIQTSIRARKSRRALLQDLKHEHTALHRSDEALSEMGAGFDDAFSTQPLQTRPDEELVVIQEDLHAR